MRRHTILAVLTLLLATTAVSAKGYEKREPDPKGKGKVYEWTAKNGTVYLYRLPKSYNPEKGANLTFILHGSNLDRRWGFANHSAKTFRPDDIVVSPDGTTSNGRGGFNSLGNPKDAKRFKEIHDEIRKALEVGQTYLYGHSQGSFFAFYYAGQFPKDVNGVVGHASGVWTQTRQGKSGHHQAIVLMHGTKDPVVPYGQSVGGLESYADAKYPMVRLRSLEGWNHWPAEHNSKVPHTSQQLAWCEGMTTEDPERLAACMEFLCTVPEKASHDYSAAYSLAQRILAMKDSPAAARQRAEKAAQAIEKLAAAHVKAMDLPKGYVFDGGPWVRHLVLFLRSFAGVPACEELRADLEKTLEQHRKAVNKHFGDYWPAKRKGDFADAFSAGVHAVRGGYLHYACAKTDFLKNLENWSEQGMQQKLKIPRKTLKDYVEYVVPYRKAIETGWNEFLKVNRKAPKL